MITTNGGTAPNGFTVDGWTGKLDINAGASRRCGYHSLQEWAPTIILTDATVTDSTRATAIILNSSFETATLHGTGSSSVGQNFNVVDWTKGGTISADFAAVSKGTTATDTKNDIITIATDVDYKLTAGQLVYGIGSPPGSGPVAATAKTWNMSGIDKAVIDLTAGSYGKQLYRCHRLQRLHLHSRRRRERRYPRRCGQRRHQWWSR